MPKDFTRFAFRIPMVQTRSDFGLPLGRHRLKRTFAELERRKLVPSQQPDRSELVADCLRAFRVVKQVGLRTLDH